jgi:hypothetical protein
MTKLFLIRTFEKTTYDNFRGEYQKKKTKSNAHSFWQLSMSNVCKIFPNSKQFSKKNVKTICPTRKEKIKLNN